MQQAYQGLNLGTKRTNKQELLAHRERLVPWAELAVLIEPHAPKSKTGRPPFALQTTLCIHFMQHWFTQSEGTSGNVNGVTQADSLLNGQVRLAFDDAEYRGAQSALTRRSL